MSKIDRLKELGEIYKSGIISEAEFKSLKKELLASAEEKSVPTEQVPEKKKVESSPPVEKKTDPVPIVPQPKTEKQNKELKIHFQDSDGFWETFQQSLESPISYWRDYKSCSVSEWMDQCNNQEFLAYLNIIFENAPLIRGEYPCVYTADTGMIITNYRLFINLETGLSIIPLKDLTHYDNISSNEFKLTYDRYGKSVRVDVSYWMLKDYVDTVKQAEQWKSLNALELEYLQYSFYEFKTKLKLRPPRVKFEYSKYESNTEKKLIATNNKSNFISPADDGYDRNIFKYIRNIYIFKPWWFLVGVSAFLGSEIWTIMCCILPLFKLEYEQNGFKSLLSVEGLFLIIFLFIPIVISLFAAIKMIGHFLTGRNYPGGEGPYGVAPFLSLLFYLAVMYFMGQLVYAFFG